MSKISPCLWFDGEAEEAARFYVSLLPNSRIDHVQKNVTDSPAGKAGSVLVVEFTLAGQRYLALNGGTRFEYTHAISFSVDCADQAEVDRLWDGLSKGGVGRAMRLAEGPLRRLLADRARHPAQAPGRSRPRQGDAGDAGDAEDGEAGHRGAAGRRGRAGSGLILRFPSSPSPLFLPSPPLPFAPSPPEGGRGSG